MKLQLYSIHDSATKRYLPPDYLLTDAEAVRKFTHNVNNKDNGFLHTHPEHYSLYVCGSYDDSTGQFETHQPEIIIKATQVANTDKAP